MVIISGKRICSIQNLKERNTYSDLGDVSEVTVIFKYLGLIYKKVHIIIFKGDIMKNSKLFYIALLIVPSIFKRSP